MSIFNYGNQTEDKNIMKEQIINFLRQKGILGPNNEKYKIVYDDGRIFDVVELIEEFTNIYNSNPKIDEERLWK